VTDDGTGTQRFTVNATVQLLRKSDGTVAKTFSSDGITEVGSEISTNQIVFGYSTYNGGGAFYATINKDGTMRAAGFNGDGQLGNGTVSDNLVPTKFLAPTTLPIVSGYTNFLSVGWSMYGIDSGGSAFGAGANSYGQIGNGTTSTSVATPSKVILPAGKQVQSVIVGGWTNYFLTTDGNIYAAGMCDYGRLGSNYTIAGCSNASTPVRVNLPAPNPADPNTMPTTNIVADRYTAYVRMAGGRVYGWGDSEYGELGINSYTPSSNPVKIGTYGDANMSKATQIAFDGNSIYVLDSNGKLASMGLDSAGQHGSRTSSLYNSNTNKCFDNTGGDGVSFRLYTCNGTPAQKFQYRSNSTIYNAATNTCLDNSNADGLTLKLHACNGTAAQVFTYTTTNAYYGSFTNPQSGKCIDNASADGVTLRLYTCNGTAAQVFSRTSTWLEPFNMTGITGQITSITTDQWHISALTTNGEVWSAGVNTSGMFGANVTNIFTPDPVKFQLPAGITGKYIYATNNSYPSNYVYQNLFVIGSNGRVYGAGSNSFGQLGNGATAAQQKTPVVMNVIDGTSIRAKEVQVGRGTAVVFTDNGKVYTVGNNDSGQIGDGTTTNRLTPYYSQYINESSPTQY
jgi:alpha-tubulin suppressor-like RCC1 family protein